MVLSDLERNTATVHMMYKTHCKTEKVKRITYQPINEPVKQWTLTFEATPCFRIVPAETMAKENPSRDPRGMPVAPMTTA